MRWLAPTAFTWVPGASHARSRIGSRVLVAVTTMSASRTAASTLGLASTANGNLPASPATNSCARSGVRPAIRTRSIGRTIGIDSRCPSA